MTSITDLQVDQAYDAMCAEIDKWELVGPMQPVPSGEVRHGKAVMVEPYMVRGKFSSDGASDNSEVPFEHFTTKAHAVAFIQYQGLRAALHQFASATAGTSGQGSDTPNHDEQA